MPFIASDSIPSLQATGRSSNDANTLYDNFTEHAVKSIEQLGMNPKDIKYVIVTHGHNEKAGRP